jgi:serine/threonine protein kinase
MVTTALFQEELQPGLELPDFVLYERIGFGGEGLIFSAWDKNDEKLVAIKFFPKRDDEGVALNIARERGQFSVLDHPNIRKIYEVGDTKDFHYSVMRYFPLGSLSERIFRSELSTHDALFVAAQIASALDFLQQRSIVHRDLKPTNILLDIENHAYLTDFGLAKPISQTTQVMHTGHGTPIYASPEQHTLSQVNNKSDLYSFGIMLYEMFSGILPWGGEVALAIMQLDNNELLPDPREEIPALPVGLVDVLRKMTDLKPENRPDSAGEAMQLVLAAFEQAGFDVPDLVRQPPVFSDPATISRKEAEHLIHDKFGGWEPDLGSIPISYSHFAFLHSVFSKDNASESLTEKTKKFMLHGAFTYGLAIPFWWDTVPNYQEQINVCQHVIIYEEEKAVKRAIARVLRSVPEQELQKFDIQQIIGRLIETADESASHSFKQVVFDLLSAATKPAQRWHKARFSADEDIKLAEFALLDADISSDAAKYIGQIKSETAVKKLLQGTDQLPGPHLPTLSEVWEAAGSMPRGLPNNIRFQIGVELGWKQMVRERTALIRTYLAAALAGILSLSLYVFISTRVPAFVTYSRILNTLGSGLLFGPVVGLGIFLSRWIARRLRIFSSTTRVLLGTVLGGFTISLAIMLFHILFLGAAPTGSLITLGSLVIAFGFSLMNTSDRPIWLQILGSGIAVAVGLAATWAIYLNTNRTPMLYYEESQPLQTTLLIGIVSLLLGGVTYLYNFREKIGRGIHNE